MRTLATMLRLDLTLQARSFVYPATVVSTGMICAFVLLLPGRDVSPRLAALFIFMDPATLGLAFVGAMVLAEKAGGTLAALGVAPLRASAYVGAKVVSLTLLTFASGLLVVAVITRGQFDTIRALAALSLCSALAVLIGLVCVARAASMNHLVVTLLWVSTLLYIPLLAHFGVVGGTAAALLAAVPSRAMLAALTASVAPAAVPAGVQAASFLYLTAWVVAGWWWAVREFERAIVTERR